MNFNGTYLKSFGHCKVLSWRNSVYTDFDRKELVHNGRVLAAVEVPTVRKIEAIILVRGNSYDDIRHKLESISSWLYEAGTAKLCHETDLTRYFLARCTQVSAPEYNGLSARCTVTFTCSDHRLYASYDDQPVTSEENNMSNFTFAGKHCLNDMGCLFVKDAEPAIPAVKPHVYEISGMNGTLRYNTGTPVLKETSMSGTLYFVKDTTDGRMTEEEITQKRHDVAAWLINAERAALIMDSDISREYQAEICAEALLNRKDWANGYLKVKFTVQPVSKSVDASSKLQQMQLAAGEAYTLDLNDLTANGIGYQTPLVLSIYVLGENTIDQLTVAYNDNGKEKTAVFGPLATDDALYLNGNDGIVQLGGETNFAVMKQGEIPVISPAGDNYLKFASNVATELRVIVSCNVRWA